MALTLYYVMPKSLPLRCGFLIDDKTVSFLEIATGDPVKEVVFNFENTSGITLKGLKLETKVFKPLRLSRAQSTLADIETIESGYCITHSGIEILGYDDEEYNINLDTKGATPGTARIEIKAYSTEQDYKCITRPLHVTIKSAKMH